MAGFGGSVKLTGESEYRKALKGITDNLTVLSSEMKVVSSSFGKNEDSITSLTQKHDILNKKLGEQNNALEEAKRMLNEAKTSTNSNATTVAKWQNEVNKAKAEVNKTTKELKDNEKVMNDLKNANVENTEQLKKFQEEERKAGDNSNLLATIIKGNLLGDVIRGGLSALTSGIKAMGSALANIGKGAINSFADYEQLIGGVETLFGTGGKSVEEYAKSVGKSVEEVQEKWTNMDTAQADVLYNAENAYKTVGMSANEYIETVTGFSASLIQSLEGDTLKASAVADMAIIDMSDNANKMGTDMATIQTAYQGFAKQNYTMLDNLKLGYGGTKTEMERLLSDATKISGIKYDISNLNDVYQAIHVIQGELGITGTTATEASTTISGSVSSMKSAWQNLLSGIANENVDFQALVDNFVNSILTVADNMLPRIQVTIEGIGLLINGFAEKLLPKILEMMPSFLEQTLPVLVESINYLIQGVVSALPQLISVISNLIPQIVEKLVSMLPQILEAGIQILTSLIQGIAQSLPTLIPTIVDAVILMVETLIDNIDLVIDVGIQLILGLADGLIEALPRLIEKAPEIIEKLVDAIIRNFPKIVQAGGQLIGKLAVGLVGALGDLLMQAPKIISTIVNGIKSGFNELKQSGLYLIQGIWEGISGSLEWIKNKIKGWVGNVTKFIKKLFGINSPSKLMQDEVGVYLAEGIGVGFENGMETVNKNIQDSIPTEFDIGVKTNLSNTSLTKNNVISQSDAFASAVKRALTGMYVVLDGDKVGEIVINNVEGAIFG